MRLANRKSMFFSRLFMALVGLKKAHFTRTYVQNLTLGKKCIYSNSSTVITSTKINITRMTITQMRHQRWPVANNNKHLMYKWMKIEMICFDSRSRFSSSLTHWFWGTPGLRSNSYSGLKKTKPATWVRNDNRNNAQVRNNHSHWPWTSQQYQNTLSDVLQAR
jgi:hypothetical protein